VSHVSPLGVNMAPLGSMAALSLQSATQLDRTGGALRGASGSPRLVCGVINLEFVGSHRTESAPKRLFNGFARRTPLAYCPRGCESPPCCVLFIPNVPRRAEGAWPVVVRLGR
jgi:hypothetical protein